MLEDRAPAQLIFRPALDLLTMESIVKGRNALCVENLKELRFRDSPYLTCPHALEESNLFLPHHDHIYPRPFTSFTTPSSL